MSFDWQTGDGDWKRDTFDIPLPVAALPADFDPDDESDVSSGSKPMRRRFWPFVTVGLILVLAIGLVLARQLQKRTEAAEAQARAEVLASYGTIERAAAAGDVELLTGFISGRSYEWLDAIDELVAQRQFADRQAFGLSLLREPAGSETPPDVVVSPDLLSAEVVTLRDYAISIGNGLTETITLRQTDLFRRGPDRWLMAPPEPSFWAGEEAPGLQHVDGRYLSLSFPTRDSALAGRLARDLDAILAGLCARSIEQPCPEEWRLQVVLTPAASALVNRLDPLARWRATPPLELPAPTLLGLPVDDAGYRALVRIYAAPVVIAAVADLTGWTCCDQGLYYAALVTALLDEIGLEPWPLGEEYYARLAERPEHLAAMAALWRGDSAAAPADQVWPAYLLARFLAEAAGEVDILDMLYWLVEQPQADYWSWLDRATAQRYETQVDLERDVLLFAREQAPATTASADPGQDLLLACRASGDERVELVRLDTRTGEFMPLSFLGSYPDSVLAAMPDDNGALVARIDEAAETLQLVVRHDGRPGGSPFHTLEIGSGLVPLGSEPGDTRLQFYLDQPVTTPSYALLPDENCSFASGCEAKTILGRATWSPDDQHAILAAGEPSPFSTEKSSTALFLADETGDRPVLVAQGSSPFWLADDMFGYLSAAHEGEDQAVLIRSIVGEALGARPPDARLSAEALVSEAQTVLTMADIRAYLGAELTSGLVIDRVLVVPSDPKVLLLSTADVEGKQEWSYLLAYDYAEDNLTALLAIGNEPLPYRRGYQWSPDGRWLALSTLRLADSAGADRWQTYLVPANGEGIQALEIDSRAGRLPDWLLDWSADGQWLAAVTGGYVLLLSPENDRREVVIRPQAACSAAVWVNRG